MSTTAAKPTTDRTGVPPEEGTAPPAQKRRRSRKAKDDASSATRTILILLVVGVVLSLYLGLRVANRVRKAVAGVAQVRVAEADAQLAQAEAETGALLAETQPFTEVVTVRVRGRG